MYLVGGRRLQGVVLPEGLAPVIVSTDIVREVSDDHENNNDEGLPIAIHNNHDVLVHLTNLNLTASDIIELEPSMYKNLPALKNLILSMNSIKEIPREMPLYLPCLKHLYLDGNQLTHLPDTISSLKDLEVLKLDGNQLEYLPGFLSELVFLTALDVSQNSLKNISTSLFFNKNLRHLNLSFNNLHVFSEENCGHFNYCNSLESLNLSHNKITSLSKLFTKEMIRLSNSSLITLDLGFNKIGIVPLELIDQQQTDVLIKGNPLIDFPNADIGYVEAVKRLLRKAIPSSYRLDEEIMRNDSNKDFIDVLLEFNAPVDNEHTMPLPETPYMLNSLREIALRNTVSKLPSVVQSLPVHLIVNMEHMGCCLVCKKHYMNEWINSVQMKQYRGDLAVIKFRFCSTKCWEAYKESMDQRAVELDNINETRRRARQFIEQEGDFQPGSLSWIMAAVTASAEQNERMELISNMF